MQNKWKLVLTGVVGIASALMMSSLSYAAEPERSGPHLVTVVKDTPFYADMTEDQPTGMLAYFQTIKVKETVNGSVGVWYKVDTWLGEQWIPGSADTVIEGEIESVNMTAHTIRTERLYDTPIFDGMGDGPALAPQEISITGRYNDWYRINTASRQQKWLYSPLLLEEIREEPADFDMLLTREEPLYEIPYLKPSPITLAPQTVHVLTQWDTGEEGYRFRPIIWYKIQTDQGPRWVLPRGEKTGVKPVHESLTLPTGGYGTPAPETNERAVWIEPGTKLEATARWNDWLQVKIGSDDPVWVSPALSLKRRPLGTVASNETLYLTQDTAAYTYPSPDAVARRKGYYAPQEVQSIAKWSGDELLDWYLFRGWDGDLWIPKPRHATDRSLVGSWSFSQLPPDTGGAHGAPLDLTFMKYSQRHGFEPEEGIPFTLRVRNTSNEAITIAPPVQFQLQIVRLGGAPEEALKHPEQQEPVWTRKLPPLSAKFPGRMSTQTIFIEWDQTDAEGKQAAPGEYAARIVPVPIPYELGEQGEARTMAMEEMQASLGEPEVFAILPYE